MSSQHIGRNSHSQARNVNHNADDDLDQVREAAIDRCQDLAEDLLGRPSFRGRREVRWGTHGKLRLRLDTGRWNDFSTGEWGDIFALYQREQGGDFAAALDWVRSMLGRPAPVRRHEKAARPVQDDEAVRRDNARAMYGRAQPARAAGAMYFTGRGLDYPEVLESQLRLDRGQLIMPFRRFTTFEVTAIHRITLERDADGRREKKSFGSVWGSAMMLGRPKDGVLGICEGLETGVAILCREQIPVWCLSGASFIAGFEPIEGVDHLFVYADNDANRAGQEAALACRDLWQEAGRLVDVVTPKVRGADFADLWRK